MTRSLSPGARSRGPVGLNPTRGLKKLVFSRNDKAVGTLGSPGNLALPREKKP